MNEAEQAAQMPPEFYEVMKLVWVALLEKEKNRQPDYKWMASMYEPIWNAARNFYQGQWVPIRTEADLPKESGDYLFQAAESGGVFTNYYSTEYSPVERYARTYAAWMPLPSPYQPKTESEDV